MNRYTTSPARGLINTFSAVFLAIFPAILSGCYQRTRNIRHIVRYISIALLTITLAACGGGGGSSPNSNNNGGSSTGSSGGSNGGPNNPSPQFATNACGNSSENQDFCNQTITSPAPPTKGANVALPNANGVEGCEANWDTSAGTTDIALTVFIPPYEDGETMPLILHSHGWGGQRVSAPRANVSTNTFIGIADMTTVLWNEGYIVISFDERGWGESEGEARVIDPCYETVDAIAILDWAEDNLPVDTSDGDIVVGGIGGSYGGAFQMMLAAMDDRIDSIMPVATWNRLADPDNALTGNPSNVDGSLIHGALVNNEVIKRGYVTGLCLLAGPGPVGAGATLDNTIETACNAVRFSGANAGNDLDLIDPEMRRLFAANGMGNPDLRTGQAPMDVDVFLVQGMRDMVFDGLEAFDNYQFFSDPANNNSSNVKLMTTDAGHMLTTFELAMSNSPNPDKPQDYQVQGDNDCGSINMFDAMVAWLDQTLRPNHTSTFQITIPEFCIALDSDNGIADLTEIPMGGNYENANLGGYTFGSSAAPITVTPASATNMDILGSPRQFLPLATMTTDGYLAGIPVLDEVTVQTISNLAGEATAFLAVGIQKGDGSLVEVDEQILPIRRSELATDNAITYSDLRMAMVGNQLVTGDQVGLLLYLRHGQYELNPGTGSEYTTNQYQIFGELELPLFDLNGTPIKPSL